MHDIQPREYVFDWGAFALIEFVGYLINKMQIADTMGISRMSVHRIIHADKLEEATQ